MASAARDEDLSVGLAPDDAGQLKPMARHRSCQFAGEPIRHLTPMPRGSCHEALP